MNVRSSAAQRIPGQGAGWRSLSDWMSKEGQRFVLLLIVVLIGAVFTARQPAFLSAQSIDNILRVTSMYGIAALGMTLVILTGGIDLSVGSTIAFGGALAAGLLGTAFGAANPLHMPYYLSIPAALILTGAIGALNGLAITVLNVAPFIATLGMMTVVRGLTYIYTDYTVAAVPGSPITFSDDFFDWIGTGNIGVLPTQAVIFVGLALATALMLRYTGFGRSIFAIGGSQEIARLAGINTTRVIIGVYALAAALAGGSGIILAGKLSSVSPLIGTGYELNVITMVVVGGASMAGGRGTITGTVLGALLISMIDNGLDLLNVPSFYQYLLKGTILIAAVIVDKSIQRRQALLRPG